MKPSRLAQRRNGARSARLPYGRPGTPSQAGLGRGSVFLQWLFSHMTDDFAHNRRQGAVGEVARVHPFICAAIFAAAIRRNPIRRNPTTSSPTSRATSRTSHIHARRFAKTVWGGLGMHLQRQAKMREHMHHLAAQRRPAIGQKLRQGRIILRVPTNRGQNTSYRPIDPFQGGASSAPRLAHFPAKNRALPLGLGLFSGAARQRLGAALCMRDTIRLQWAGRTMRAFGRANARA